MANFFVIVLCMFCGCVTNSSEYLVSNFWSDTVNSTTCGKTRPGLIKYSETLMGGECNVSYDNEGQILKKTLCQSIVLLVGLICTNETSSVTDPGNQLETGSMTVNGNELGNAYLYQVKNM